MKNKLIFCALLLICSCANEISLYKNNQKRIQETTFHVFKGKCWAVNSYSQRMHGFMLVPDEMCDQQVEKQCE